MCGGASTAQNNISAEQQQEYTDQQQQYTQLEAQYNQIYGQDQGILSNLTANITPIVNAGPSQTGYSNDELSNLNSQATEGTAQGYAQAQQALNENTAATGGASYIPSGGNEELAGQLAATGAGALASQKSSILSSDYAQGNQNYNAAVSDEEGIAGLLNPTAYEGESINSANATTSSGNAAASEANTITQQNNSIWSTVLGSLGGIAGSAASGFGAGAAKSLFT